MSDTVITRRFSVNVYRINGLIELEVEAESKDAALAQACDMVARGIRIQPDGQGPRLFWRDARELLCVGVLAGDELPWRHDPPSPEKAPADESASSQPSPYSE